MEGKSIKRVLRAQDMHESLTTNSSPSGAQNLVDYNVFINACLCVHVYISMCVLFYACICLCGCRHMCVTA